MRAVVDSSIIVKWLNTENEKNVEEANTLLTDALDDNITLIAPELAKYEVGNVLLKGKKLTVEEVQISLKTIHALPITFFTESEALARETYEIAFKNNITYYDASFMALAKQYKATLITENIKHQGKSNYVKVSTLKDY